MEKHPASMKKHVVVAEDSPATLERTCLTVSRLGFDVYAATNGKAAWNHIKEREKIDLLITGIRMPFMDGYELINNMADAGYQIPIIIFAAECLPLKIKEYKGKMAFYQKPLCYRQDENRFLRTVKEFAEGK